MDTSDPQIKFNEKGECEYCINFKQRVLPDWNHGKGKETELTKLSERILKEGAGKDFDCIIGLSGGLDSSYTAYVAKEIMGLRPLLFHVDAGWNTNKAVENIAKLVNKLDLDLFTDVINWEEMKDLQLSFLKSQIADQDFPQDIAFFSSLYKFARKNKIRYILTGGNFSTECCREPEEWGAYPGIDSRLIRDIHKKFGRLKLRSFPIIDIFKYKIYYKYFLRMNVVKPLNLTPYDKKNAERDLASFCGWEAFQHKHHESRFTRFYEDYWMPKKFGYEKRRAHFSSLIMTSQMNRDEALERLKHPELDENFSSKEFSYVAKKLDITDSELLDIFHGPNKTFRQYKNKHWIIGIGARVLTMLNLEKRLFR